jgi:hypothetical protein
VHQVNPLAGQVGQRAEVGLYGKPLRLEATHLAWRSRAALRRHAADDPANSMIMTQTFGIVHVLVASQTAEHRLPQQTNQRMATILAGPRIGEHLTCQRGQPKRVVKLAIGEQSSIRCHHRAAKLEHQAAVEIEPNSIRFRFTRWVRRRRLAQSTISC